MHEETPEIQRIGPRPTPELGVSEQTEGESSCANGSLPSGATWRTVESDPSELVDNSDSNERYSTARALAWTPSNDVTVAYTHGDDTVRSAIVATIGERGRIWDIALLNDALRSGNAQLRFVAAAAARSLLRYTPEYDDCGNLLPGRRFGEPPFSVTCCALGDALYAGPEVVSREAARALMEIGPRAGRPYIEALTISSSSVRSCALDAAIGIGLEGARSPFPQALEEGTKSERLVIAKALGVLGSETRSRARGAISSVGGDLLSKLDDPRVAEVTPSDEVMAEVSKLRSEMIAAVRILASMVNDYSTEVRIEALHALSVIGPGARAARGQIGSALSDPRQKVREAARRAEESMRD